MIDFDFNLGLKIPPNNLCIFGSWVRLWT